MTGVTSLSLATVDEPGGRDCRRNKPQRHYPDGGMTGCWCRSALAQPGQGLSLVKNAVRNAQSSGTTASSVLLRLTFVTKRFASPRLDNYPVFTTRLLLAARPSLKEKMMSEPGRNSGHHAGVVEAAIRAHITPGLRLPTPTGRASFIVHELNARGIVLLLGPKHAWTPLSWDCLEGIPDVLRNRGWMRVGANRDVAGNPGTLDAYLKGCLKRQTADYVAVVLERAGLVDLDRDLPARVRLSLL